MAYASRQGSYILGSLGAVLQVIAGWWDVYSHSLLRNTDPWWNPAHLAVYAGVAIVILAVWRGLLRKSPQPSYGISQIHFANTAGLKLAGFGSVIQIIAGTLNVIVHHVFLSEPKIAPAHALLTFGMLTINLGMIIGLSIEYGMVNQKILSVSSWRRYVIVLCMILVFSSIWLAAGGAFIYVARLFRNDPLNWGMAMLLAIVGPLVLVPAKRVLPQFGTGIAVGLTFNLVPLFLFVGYAGTPAYVPWGIVPLVVLDVLAVGLKGVLGFRGAVTVASTVLGFLFSLTYFPFTVYLFPWSFAMQLPLAIVFLGGGLGVMLGNRVYAWISSLVLGNIM